MARGTCALALLCALVASAVAYTVDCNHEYTDCDTELSKIISEDDDHQPSTLPSIPPRIAETSSLPPRDTTSTTTTPARSTPTARDENVNVTDVQATTEINEVTEPIAKPKPRLLNLKVDELQNFANVLHNQTKGFKKTIDDLSDLNLDEDVNERDYGPESRNKQIPDKFYSNLQTPFNPLSNADKSDETETCKEGGVTYKVGEHVDRGCEETCECNPGGVFECSPRCKHPFIRRGRRLSDPLCFESPVDECCSIVACANRETKPASLEVCRHGNETYTVGEKWHIGCAQTCSCEQNSLVTCRPRCDPLPQSDKCINVQDPTDECCEMQICDVSQDAHEENENMTSSTTEIPQKTSDLESSPPRPLVLTEPIGSIKVLQNNTVQVNLMHVNNSDDPIHLLLSSDGGNTFHEIELKYSNLILNLEGGKDYILKTKETGTKFNFTITASDVGNEVPVEETINGKEGCYHDGKFYNVGDEFHIGCSELCECTGADTRECAPLQCPTHVGLELVSRGCVQWAPSPPARPPDCCPRTARCLSDGTCHYKGVPIPNWTEVPISLTGCEEHCFCENGSLDCQEACAPLPALPPPSLRCAPRMRPAPVNASDDDCCKVWGCVPSAGNMNATYQTYTPTRSQYLNYVTPITPLPPTINPPSFLPTPATTTKMTEFYGRYSPIKTSLPKFFKTQTKNRTTQYFDNMFPQNTQSGNVTVFTPEDTDAPLKIIHPEPSLMFNAVDWGFPIYPMDSLSSKQNIHKTSSTLTHETHLPNTKPFNIILSDDKLHDIIEHSKYGKDGKLTTINSHDLFVKQMNDDTAVKKILLSQYNYKINHFPLHTDKSEISQRFFEPSSKLFTSSTDPSLGIRDHYKKLIHNLPAKRITVLKNKDLKIGPTDIKTTAWAKNNELNLLAKGPNSYETVLLKALPKQNNGDKFNFDPALTIPKVPTKTYSSLDLEHLLNQMELESDTNKNLGRSADKSRGTITAGQMPPGLANLPPPTPPAFLPTIPSNDRYPSEDTDYEQNNIHRPLNPLEPLQGLPPGLPIPEYGGGDDNKKLQVLALQGDSPTSIKMLFGLPPVLVGLRGSVDLRYTDTADEDITQWYSQVFAPADEILTTPRLEFRLTGLKPSTTYKIRGKLFLHNLPVEPESEIYTVRTQDLPTVAPPEEKRRQIDCKLTVVEVNDTSAYLSWRHFTEDELQYIDGIQVRYRPTGTPIYSTTELLHHSRSGAALHELRPLARYEAALVLAPPPHARSELYDPAVVEFTTLPLIDPYNWTVTITAEEVGATSARVTWRGAPAPAERWVRVYRAAHACREERDAFRLAARDAPEAITLSGLEPDSRCRVWLELFLTNGKVKTSNVLEIHTKPLDSDEPLDNTIEASSVRARGDYYGALVAVGAVAALAALVAALLLLVLLRRHRPRSVAITSVPSAPRESSLPPYDNPAYKLELQQETMNL